MFEQPGYLMPDAVPRGFGILLDECVKARADEEVLVVYDESVQRFVHVLTDALLERSLHATFLFVPKTYQFAMMERVRRGGQDNDVPLPKLVGNAFSDASVVLTMLDGDLATSRVRGAMLSIRRERGCRCAHIPGLSRAVLEVLSESPIDEIFRHSELLAWALGEAETGELVSFTARGERHSLTLQLDGWRCDPLMSPGVIFPDTWGNVPPGETFFCPDSYAQIGGSICLNGSIPGHALRDGEEAVLEFREGRLVRWRPANSPVAAFLEQRQQVAQRRGDDDWNAFAELGIGLNPAVRKLTGNSLFDEKAAGTVHVAIGDNSIFDGPLTSELHADMVVVRPTLVLDRHTVICDGDICLQTLLEWRTNTRAAPIVLNEKHRLEIDRAHCEVRDNRLFRRLARTDRVGYVEIGTDSVSRAAATLVKKLRTEEPMLVPLFTHALSSLHLPEPERVLGLLHHYDILKVIT